MLFKVQISTDRTWANYNSPGLSRQADYFVDAKFYASEASLWDVRAHRATGRAGQHELVIREKGRTIRILHGGSVLIEPDHPKASSR